MTILTALNTHALVLHMLALIFSRMDSLPAYLLALFQELATSSWKFLRPNLGLSMAPTCPHSIPVGEEALLALLWRLPRPGCLLTPAFCLS